MGEVNPFMAYAAPASAPPASSDRGAMFKKLQGILDRFEISIAEANDLVVLQDYEMVVIADDSGSMLNNSLPPEMRVLGAPYKTRWDELKETVAEIVEIASCFDESGVDVFFLNRPAVLGVRHATDHSFTSSFAAPPRGTTPLTETLQRVAQKTAGERPVLLFILTDGEPNGGKGPFTAALKQLVAADRPNKLRVQIMACTADSAEVGWLNQVDEELAEVDVTDDYVSEKQEVINAGRVAKFTRGDWCMKAMLGPVSSKFDAWDERAQGAFDQADCGIACALM